MSARVIDIGIARGKTFEKAYQYAEENLEYPSITAMPNTAPVRLTINNHGIPDGWLVQIDKVTQPVELNSDKGMSYRSTFIDENTIELNKVHATGWRPFIPGGVAIFKRPFDLTGCSARMQIRDRVGGKVLLTLSSDPNEDRDGTIEVNVPLAALIAHLSPAVTAAITWTKGVYDLELITPSGDVYPATAISAVTVGAEVTQ